MPMSSPWGTTESTRFLSSARTRSWRRGQNEGHHPEGDADEEEAEMKAMKPLRRRERL
jgi:hypothetical protein